MKFDKILAELNPDTYRAGDPDFEFKRTRCHDMVERHLSKVENIPLKKTRKTKRKSVKASEVQKGEETSHGRIPGVRPGMNNRVGAVEYMNDHRNILDSAIEPPHTDLKRDMAVVEGNVRRRVAFRLRALFEGAELTPLRSVDLEAIPSGEFGPRSVADRKLDCQTMIQDMRREIPPACMAILERVVMWDEFIWEVASRKARRIVLDELRMALDFAAWSLGIENKGRQEITREKLRQRWPEADEFFRQRILRPAMHNGKVIRQPRSDREQG